jgi:hypothetical protein
MDMPTAPAPAETTVAKSAAEIDQEAQLSWFVTEHMLCSHEYDEERDLPFGLFREEYELFCRACRFTPMANAEMCESLKYFGFQYEKDADGVWMIKGFKLMAVDLSAAVVFADKAGPGELRERASDASKALDELALLIAEGAPTATLRRFMAKHDNLRRRLKLGDASDDGPYDDDELEAA